MPAPAPQALEAEERVLGAMMLSRRAADTVAGILKPADFYLPGHGLIYQAILDLYAAGVDEADFVSVEHELEDQGRLAEAGGKARIREIATLAPGAGNAHHWARIVRDQAIKRRALGIAQTFKAEVEAGQEAKTAIAQLARDVDELGREADQERAVVITGYQAAEHYHEKIKNPPPVDAGVATPWPFLQPIQPWLHVFGGYMGDGKTVAAVQFLRAACEAGKRVGFVTIEMSWEDLTDRIVSCHGVPYQEAISGRFTSPLNEQIAKEAVARIAGWQVDLIDDPWIDVQAIRRYARAGAYDLLVIDHLHQLDWEDRRALERNLRAIANTSRELRLPILLLAQLKRGDGEGSKAFPRPTMASFRETGMIEATAAVCWFVYRHRNPEGERLDQSEFIVAKNRYGAEGHYGLRFDGANVRFKLPPEEPPAGWISTLPTTREEDPFR